MTRVSVCIPAYNAARFLHATLDSVWAQDFEDFEVVVVDDGSTDNTREILAAQDDSRLRFWSHETNKGQGQTMDEAVAHAHGEFVKFLDADDSLHPGCLRKMVEALEAHPDASFVFCRRDVLVEQTDPEVARAWLDLHGHLERGFGELAEINSGPELLARWIADGLGDNWIAEPAGVMARRTSLDRVGGYSRRVRLVNDMELWARLMTCGNVAFIDEPLYEYRLSMAGVTGNAVASDGQWLDGLWSLEGLIALRPAPNLPLLHPMRRRLLRRVLRIAVVDLVSRRPHARDKVRDLVAYGWYRVTAAVGRAQPLFVAPSSLTR